MGSVKGFFIDLGIKVIGFAVAKGLEAIPDDMAETYAHKGGVWFTTHVTPYISEKSEAEIQGLMWSCAKGFNEGADSDEV